MSAIARRLANIQTHGGISGREVAQLLNTTPQTVSRWKRGRASPQPDSLDRLLQLDWLADQLCAFYKPDEARLWLLSPHPELGGESPANRIAQGGVGDVLAILDRLQSGAYV